MQSNRLPNHIAIIPDGNRRWAKEKMLPSFLGHKEGYKRVKELTDEVRSLGVQFFTVWAFSTENWKRDEEEKKELFSLLGEGLDEIASYVKEKKSRFIHLGRKDRLGEVLLSKITNLEEVTKENTDFTLCVAIDYGGEDEIIRAEEKLLLSKDTSKHVQDFLDTTRHGIPSPDIIVRTGGETRTSGFMPLQSAYSEWFFSPLYFPQFTVAVLHEVLREYEKRERRFGK